VMVSQASMLALAFVVSLTLSVVAPLIPTLEQPRTPSKWVGLANYQKIFTPWV